LLVLAPNADEAETFGQLKTRILTALAVPPDKADAVTLCESFSLYGHNGHDANASVMAALEGKHWSDDAFLYVTLARADSADEGSDDAPAIEWRAALMQQHSLTSVHRIGCANDCCSQCYDEIA
jgi:hypothetical protein